MAERFRLDMQPVADMKVVELGTGRELSSDDPVHNEVATRAAGAMMEAIEQAGGMATIHPIRMDRPVEPRPSDGPKPPEQPA